MYWPHSMWNGFASHHYMLYSTVLYVHPCCLHWLPLLQVGQPCRIDNVSEGQSSTPIHPQKNQPSLLLALFMPKSHSLRFVHVSSSMSQLPMWYTNKYCSCTCSQTKTKRHFFGSPATPPLFSSHSIPPYYSIPCVVRTCAVHTEMGWRIDPTKRKYILFYFLKRPF